MLSAILLKIVNMLKKVSFNIYLGKFSSQNYPSVSMQATLVTNMFLSEAALLPTYDYVSASLFLSPFPKKTFFFYINNE